MKLVVSIDTEEDNWGDFTADNFSCSNIGELAELQELFDELEVKPTYLVTYQVASDDKSSKLLASFASSGRAEVGAHCHPWNTPPFNGPIKDKDTMLCNLSEELQLKKVEKLTEKLEEMLGFRPFSFRAGRWGYDSSVAKTISKLGYKVDSSITPYVTWKEEFGPDFTGFGLGDGTLSSDKLFSDSSLTDLLEVPATVGFTQKNQSRAAEIHSSINRTALKNYGVNGILSRLGLVNKTWLSPEIQSTQEMKSLVDALVEEGVGVLNIVFHSLSLAPGLGPFVRNDEDRKNFIASLKEVIQYCQSKGARSATLSDFISDSL